MAYVYEVFGSTYAGGVALPLRVVTQPVGSGEVPSSLVQLPGGNAWDSLGSGMARPRSQKITITGVWLAASKSAMETKLDALKAMKGTRNKLWASVDSGTTNRWRYARCLDVRAVAKPGLQRMMPIEMDFELVASPWNGTAHAAESTTLDASPHDVVTTNAGNAWVRDAIITITASGSSITVVSVSRAAIAGVCGIIHWHWTGTLAATKSLIINCGTRSVTNDGADAWAGFVFQADHADNEIAPLVPGVNTIVVARTGGDNSSTCKLDYSDGWV